MTNETDTPPTPADPTAGADAANAGWPLFYRDPQLLSAETHADWRIRSGPPAFASGTNAVPVGIGEFAAAAPAYPLVFAGPDRRPVAVLGLGARNAFVDDDGRWRDGRYVPAYVRRYPFVFVRRPDHGDFALAIDAAAAMIDTSGTEGAPLFEAGAPSVLARGALAFCDAFTRDMDATRTFVDALVAEDILVERSAHVTPAAGAPARLGGFAVVDADAFSRLPDDVVVRWHRCGWLAAVHAHLASLGRFPDLLR